MFEYHLKYKQTFHSCVTETTLQKLRDSNDSRKASMRLCEKTFHPHDPISQGHVCSHHSPGTTRWFLCTVIDSHADFSYYPRLACVQVHTYKLTWLLIFCLRFDNCFKKSVLIGTLGTINNVPANSQSWKMTQMKRNVPSTEMTFT